MTELDLSPSIPGPELPHGFSIRAARMDDYEQLVIARNSAFDFDLTGDDLLNDAMRKPGYQPHEETIVVTDGGRVAAFAVCHIDELYKIGHFEPVGTHRDFHRRRLAKVMMCRVLQQLRAAGMQRATVAHATTNPRSSSTDRLVSIRSSRHSDADDDGNSRRVPRAAGPARTVERHVRHRHIAPRIRQQRAPAHGPCGNIPNRGHQRAGLMAAHVQNSMSLDRSHRFR